MNRAILLFFLILCQFAHIMASVWMLVCIIANPRSHRAFVIARSYDRLINAVTGGEETETISGRANEARLRGQRWGCLLCRFLDKLQKNHCETAK